MKNFIKIHPSAWRYISISAILSIVFPIIFITAYAGTVGKYIGVVGYSFVAFWGTLEVARNLGVKWYTALFIALLSILMFVYPWNKMNPNIIKWPIKINYITTVFFSWKTNLVILFGSMIVVIDPAMRINIKDMLIKLFIIIFTIFTISIFAKFAWTINMYYQLKLFYFLIIAIVADSFAYFGGKYLGKKMFSGAKLAPKISPKKTWAGFVIGYLFAAIFVGVVGWYTHSFETTNSETITLITLSLILPVISVLGDLIFSWFKRYLNIKDFSNLLPGHGGILDRLDAMSVVVSFIWLAFLIL